MAKKLLIVAICMLCIRPFLPKMRTSKLDTYLILRESLWICEDQIYRARSLRERAWWINAHSETYRRLKVAQAEILDENDCIPIPPLPPRPQP
jgi:hypothetical protein